MSNVLKSKYLLGVTVAVAMVVAFAIFATSALAYVHTVTLKQGSSGSQVMALQQALGVTADGAFGPMTKAAVMAFQTSKGLVADGVVGPMTGAALSGGYSSGGSLPAGCTSTSGYSVTTGQSCASSSSLPAGCMPGYMYSSTTGAKCDGSSSASGPLTGTDGSINDVDTLSQYSNEEVGEGQDGVKVAGFELQASNDGDISIKSLKLSFDPTGNAAGDSDHLDDYISAVDVWMGSTKVGSADVDEFTENSDDTYSKTVTLNGAVVKADETEKFYISVDAAGTFDSGDIDSDSWTVAVESVRYEDGSGVVSTDTTTGDLGNSGTGIGTDGTAGDGVPIAFVTFAQAANTELKLSSHSDSPDDGIVVVSDTGTTDDVLLLQGKLEAKGDSDITIDEFPVTFGVTSSNFNVIAEDVRLVLDGEEYSESVASIAAGATASITFDDLDFTIDAGDTITFKVMIDVADADDFTAGATVTASVTATNRAAIDAENEEGDQLAAGERSGTVGGDPQEFRQNGPKVELVSVDAVKSAVDADNGDTGLFTIKFKVTALGDDIYVASVASPDGAMANAYTLDYSGTATTTDQSAALVNTTDATLSSAGTYLIEEGESETFTMTVVRNASATDGLYRVSLTSVRWTTDGTDSTPDNTYTSELDAYKTPYIALD